jgi:hypothetical protein
MARKAGSDAVIAMAGRKATPPLAWRPAFRHDRNSNDAR